MRKLYSLVLLGLLASTNPIFAMDDETTNMGVEIGEFSSSAPGAKNTAKVAPEGDGGAWYDEEVAAGSPDARGRTKSYEEGKWDDEGPLEDLAQSYLVDSTSAPLAASVLMSAASDKAKLSLQKMAEEDDEDSLPKAAALGRQVSEIEGETIEGETPKAVAAPAVIYFESIPDRETAKAILSGLIKDQDAFTTNQLAVVLNYLFDPTQDETPKDGFDFNDFARKLAACDDVDAQRKLLTVMENEHGKAWESDEDDAKDGLDD